MKASYPVREAAVTCLVDCRDKLGEGAFWCPVEQAVFWLDIPMPSRFHRYHPASGQHETWPMPEMITAAARRRDGTFLIASHSGINTFDRADGRLVSRLRPERDIPGNRANDGAPDARGRFWIGTMANNLAPDGSETAIRPGQGNLWRIDQDLAATRMESGIGISNGLAWSPDQRTFYLVDSMSFTIYAYDFDLERGLIANRRVLSDVRDLGHPDGSAVDADGYIWNARWGGGCVVRLAPDGRIDRVVPVPAERVTSCAFGGPDLATLYLTTSRQHLGPESLARHPQQGGLFALSPGVRGLPRPQFAG